MVRTRSLASPSSSLPDPLAPTRYRSGAVARMLGMPVATLRVWERRYGLTPPAPTPSGQRLYSTDDVRRLTVIKRLTDLGHAIGTLAPLDMAQLQQVAATHAQTSEATRRDKPSDEVRAQPAPAWRLAVIGTALGARLQRHALMRHLGRPVILLGPFHNMTEAATWRGPRPDLLLIHQPPLHEGWLATIEKALPAFAGTPIAVLYRFAADSVCEALAAAGVALLREPQPDVVVAQWLKSLATRTVVAPLPVAGYAEPETVAPHRWDDAALTDFASLSPTMTCECPRHVVELLIQLLHFEVYSAECEHRNSADAALHAYLRRVAASSRARFETALEQVALHEGLPLPAASTSDVAAAGSKRARAGFNPGRT